MVHPGGEASGSWKHSSGNYSWPASAPHINNTLITVKTLLGISAPFGRLIIRFLFFPVARRVPQSRHRSPQREDVSE